MVTTLEPVARRAAVRPGEVRTGESAGNVPGYLKAEKARDTIPSLEINPDQARPEKAAPPARRSFLARLTGSLGAVDRALSGPPMTDREREQRAINEANSRFSAALMWSQRISW